MGVVSWSGPRLCWALQANLAAMSSLDAVYCSSDVVVERPVFWSTSKVDVITIAASKFQVLEGLFFQTINSFINCLY